MFSSRFHWDMPPNRLTAFLCARRAVGATILDLTESNPTRTGLAYPAGVWQSLGDPRSLLYAPEPAGLAAARESVAAYYAARGAAVAADRILLTASTSEGYAYLFKLLADPGDEVLVPRPSYPLFEFLAAMESVAIRHYPLAWHGSWSIDFDALERVLSPRTRAIVLVNPNNPTGSFLKHDERERLQSLVRARGLALISDEVFSDYAFGPDERRVATLAGTENAYAMSGLSKIAGLPQMKLGWIVAPDAAAYERLEWIADTYLSVATPVQHALPRLLEAGEGVREQIRVRTCANLAFLRAAFGPDSPCRVLPVEGGWYATVQVPRVRTEEEWTLELLEHDGVLVQPGYFYDFESEAFLVLSLLTPEETFREGAARLAARASI